MTKHSRNRSLSNPDTRKKAAQTTRARANSLPAPKAAAPASPPATRTEQRQRAGAVRSTSPVSRTAQRRDAQQGADRPTPPSLAPAPPAATTTTTTTVPAVASASPGAAKTDVQKQQEIQALLGQLLSGDTLKIKSWTQDGRNIKLSPENISQLSTENQKQLLADLVALRDAYKAGNVGGNSSDSIPPELRQEVLDWLNQLDKSLDSAAVDNLLDPADLDAANTRLNDTSTGESLAKQALDILSSAIGESQQPVPADPPPPQQAPPTAAASTTRTPPPPPPPPPPRQPAKSTAVPAQQPNPQVAANPQPAPQPAPTPEETSAAEAALRDGTVDLVMPAKVGGNDKLWFAHPVLPLGWLQVRPGNDNDVMRRELSTIDQLRLLGRNIPVANVYKDVLPPQSLTIAAERMEVNPAGGVWMEKVDIATSKKPASMVLPGTESAFIAALTKSGVNLERAELQLNALLPHVGAISKHVGELDLTFSRNGDVRLLDVAPAQGGKIIADGGDEAIDNIRAGLVRMIEAIHNERQRRTAQQGGV